VAGEIQERRERLERAAAGELLALSTAAALHAQLQQAEAAAQARAKAAEDDDYDASAADDVEQPAASPQTKAPPSPFSLLLLSPWIQREETAASLPRS
jgi:E3 ubiquitin-protein ligase BOI-like protein